MANKLCSRCKVRKPLADFSPDRRAPSGRQPACKACHAARAKELRMRDPEGHRKRQREYYAEHRERIREKAAEYRDADRFKYRSAARQSYRRRREKHIAWVNANRKANPERLREWARGWQATRRAAKAGGATAAETRAWAKSQPKVCYWCGAKCARSYHIDHYQPLSSGGAHEIGNLVIACPPCNLSKAAKDPLDFAREVGRLL